VNSSQRKETLLLLSTSVLHIINYTSFTQVLLSMALINAKNCQGVAQTCRALLDSGFQSNFATEDLVHRLRFKINISSKHHAFNVTIHCFVLKEISDLPVHLHFGTPYVGQIKESPNHPLFQKTLFSWIFDGRCTQTLSQSKAQQHVT